MVGYGKAVTLPVFKLFHSRIDALIVRVRKKSACGEGRHAGGRTTRSPQIS